MFDYLSLNARRVMGLARQEAQRLKHECIGSEHILLGLVLVRDGAAATVFRQQKVEPDRIRTEVEKIAGRDLASGSRGRLPFTPRAKKALELSVEAASDLCHRYIGTEHLLLGLLRDETDPATSILEDLGVRLQSMRDAVLAIVEKGDFPGALKSVRPPLKPRPQMSAEGGFAIDWAVREADIEGAAQVRVDHLLLGLLESADEGYPLFQALGLTPEKVREEIRKLQGGGS